MSDNEKAQATTTSEPSDEELESLRHVPDGIPLAAWLVMLFAGAERFTYTGFTAPLQNYIQNPRSDSSLPGALGQGQAIATALNCFLNVFSYVSPIGAAAVADGYLGPFLTITYSAVIYIIGLIILFVTSIPSVSEDGAGLGGLIASLVLIGLGIGGIKSSVIPLMVDQLTAVKTRVKTLPNGDKVVVDRDITVRRIYSIYYWVINLGGLVGMLTTLLEKKRGFWAAFLLPLCSLAPAVIVFALGRSKYIHQKREKGMLPNLMKVLGLAVKGGFNLDNAKQSYQAAKHNRSVDWDDDFISHVRQAVHSCRVALIYPIVWLCFSQNQTNLVSQAADMLTYGIPNDMIAMLNPICVIIIVPILDKLVYPAMKQMGLEPRPTVRMTIGFLFTAASMAIAAGIQQLVYTSPPCYDKPQHCSENPGPNRVSVALQIPIYVAGAIGEVFFSASGSEFAYSQAPPGMKSIVQAIFASTFAVSSLLGLAVSPAAKDPNLVIMFAAFAGAMFVSSIIFALFFWKLR
ncbi:PTR2-domain-containing protein [Aspergillus avenaceus]|uniref:PTR2-domain-containing protein n=1 Tax=Aspergillus avenaceus TaxID=36643 RepID=A0A5N6TVZ3_ASPAV|nr:PTR2-domain-containing protein [Aspergillus avenaceus]